METAGAAARAVERAVWKGDGGRSGKPMRPSPPRPVGEGRGPIATRFFLTAIAVTLTAGATLGALRLLDIAVHGSSTAPTIFAIDAHAEAQIYGWVGLFVICFAYQVFPCFWGTRLALRPAALTSFALMVVGTALRAVAEPPHGRPDMRPFALAAGSLQVAAVVVSAGVLCATAPRAPGRCTTCSSPPRRPGSCSPPAATRFTSRQPRASPLAVLEQGEALIAVRSVAAPDRSR